MLCRSAKTMMYLYRPDELTERERARLEKHLSGCARCAAEARRARRAEEAVANLRGRTPVMDDLHAFTLSVMRSVESGGRAPRTAPRLSVRWAAILQATRPALDLALIALLIAFLTPLYLDAQRVAALEQRLAGNAGRPADQGSPGSAEFLSRSLMRRQGTILSQRAELLSLPTLLGLAEGMGLSDRSSRQTLVEHISSTYPRLASVKLDDGIDERERAILSTDGAALLRELQALIDAEGKTNAH